MTMTGKWIALNTGVMVYQATEEEKNTVKFRQEIKNILQDLTFEQLKEIRDAVTGLVAKNKTSV